MRFVTWSFISKRMRSGPGRSRSAAGRFTGCHPFYLILVSLSVVAESGCSLVRNGRENLGPVEPSRVVLQWKADARFSGFNVYRSEDDGTKSKVNTAPVKPLSESSSGIVPYEFEERGLIAGREYYYLFEEIDRNGKTRLWETERKAVAQPLP